MRVLCFRNSITRFVGRGARSLQNDLHRRRLFLTLLSLSKCPLRALKIAFRPMKRFQCRRFTAAVCVKRAQSVPRRLEHGSTTLRLTGGLLSNASRCSLPLGRGINRLIAWNRFRGNRQRRMMRRTAHRARLTLLQISRQHAGASRALQLLQPLQRSRIGIVANLGVLQGTNRLLIWAFGKRNRTSQFSAAIDHLLRIALGYLRALNRCMRFAACSIGTLKRITRSLRLLCKVFGSRFLRNARLQLRAKRLRTLRGRLRRRGLGRILARIRQCTQCFIRLRLRRLETPLRFDALHFRIR